MSSPGAEKHLGRHLEDIALFTLPPSLFEGDEDEAVDESEADNNSGEEASASEGDTTTQVVQGNKTDEVSLGDVQPGFSESTTSAGPTSITDQTENEDILSNVSTAKTRRQDSHEWDSSEAEQDSTDKFRNLRSTIQRRDTPANAQAVTLDNIDDTITTLSQMNIQQPPTISAGNTNLIPKFTRSRRPRSSSEPATSTDQVSEGILTKDLESASTTAETNTKSLFSPSKSFEVIPHNENYRNAILNEQPRRATTEISESAGHLARLKESHEPQPMTKDSSSSSAQTQAQQDNGSIFEGANTKSS